MKSNLAATILVLVCLGLGAGLWIEYQSHTTETQKLRTDLKSNSTHVATLEEELAREAADNAALSNNLIALQLKASNDLAVVQTTLSSTSKDLDKAQAEAKASANAVTVAAANLAEKEARIHALETQNNDLDKESSDLRGSLTNLEIQIQATQKKLDASEGDKKLLMAELKRLQAQKEELERKLSDLASLKEQVRTLKENLSIARRLDFIRQGLYDIISQKGGGRMMAPAPAPAPPVTTTNKSLDVEFHQSGDIKVNSPAGTNGPPSP